MWRMVVWEERVGEWGPGLLEALKGIEDPRSPVESGILCQRYWRCRCARCWEGPGACTPLPNGDGSIPGWPNAWGSAGNRPRAWQRCTTFSAGWDVEAFESALGRWAKSPWERRGHHCHRRQGSARDSRGGIAWGKVGGGICPGKRLVVGQKGSGGSSQGE